MISILFGYTFNFRTSCRRISCRINHVSRYLRERISSHTAEHIASFFPPTRPGIEELDSARNRSHTRARARIFKHRDVPGTPLSIRLSSPLHMASIVKVIVTMNLRPSIADTRRRRPPWIYRATALEGFRLFKFRGGIAARSPPFALTDARTDERTDGRGNPPMRGNFCARPLEEITPGK